MAAQNAPISTFELCDALMRQYRALDGRTVVFDFEDFYGEGSPCPPAEGPQANHFICAKQCRVTREARRFRIEHAIVRVGPRMEGSEGERTVDVWDGIQARSLAFDRDEADARSFAILREPPIGFGIEHFNTWLGWWVFTNKERHGFIELLQRGDIEGPDLLPDGRTRWRGPYPPYAAQFILIARRIDGRVELDEAEVRQYYGGKATELEGDIQSSARWVFGPSAGDVKCHLSSTCEVTVCFWRPGHPAEPSPNDFWGISRIALRAVEDEALTRTTFRPPPGPKATILDDRYRIAYVQGSRYLTIDGRLLKTSEVLMGEDVGKRLEWWVENGIWIRGEETFDESPKPRKESSLGSLLSVWPVTMAMILVGSMTVIRKRGRLPLIAGLVFINAGCTEKDPSNASNAETVGTRSSPVIAHDFGKVAIDEGPTTVKHVFRIANRTQRTVDISEIRRTCGCLEARADKTRLEPGEIVSVDIALEVKKPGFSSQGAWLILSDDSTIGMNLTAIGTRRFEFMPILDTFESHEGLIPIRFYVIDDGGGGEKEPPQVVSPEGIRLRWTEWISIEEGGEGEEERPMRQVASAQLDLSGYSGAYPIELAIKAASGTVATCRIGQESPPGCSPE